jgi:hypothetical protein
MPDAENPKPKQSEDIEDPKVPTEISINEYHRLADEYLEDLVTKLEAEAEKNPKMEVEYSVHAHFILILCSWCTVANELVRLVSSKSTWTPKVSTSLTSSPPISRSGLALHCQAQNDSTGLSLASRCIKRRVLALVTGSI